MTSIIPRRKPRDVGVSRRLWLGRDEWGIDRHMSLAGIPGITEAGLPGTGKTSANLSDLCQLAPYPEHQFVIIDGKDGGDYDDWTTRAWLFSGDDLQQAKNHMGRCVELMRRRQGVIRAELGTTNFWDIGPTPEWPLLFILVDECHTFLAEPRSSMPKEEQEAYRYARSGEPICSGMITLTKPRKIGVANNSSMTAPWIVNSWL